MDTMDVVEIILSVIGIATIIVKFTPTPKDDKILGKIKGFVSKFLALNEDPEVSAGRKPKK